MESARAGEAGAGFAVVADEVRDLAMRAAEAAKNTGTLIQTTVDRVTDGSRQVNQTKMGFDQVSEQTDEVVHLVSEITGALREQVQGIGQVSESVTGMDKITQQNAANAEESASMAEELSAQAEEMRALVSELAVMMEGGRLATTDVESGDHIEMNPTPMLPSGPIDTL